MQEIGKPAESGPLRGQARREDWLDRGAFVASAACLVHCLVLPLLLATLPALGIAGLVPENFHRLMLALIVPTSGYALYLGWARRRKPAAVLTGALGVACLAAGSLLMDGAAETIITVCGSLLVATAHTINWRSRRARC